MQRSARYLVALAIVLGLAWLGHSETLAAQDTGGELLGSVQAADGSPLANVRVTVSSTSLVGSRAVRTGPQGSFRITRLPVGLYSVEFGSIGYRTTVYAEVPVVLGSATAVGGGVVILESAPVALAPGR